MVEKMNRFRIGDVVRIDGEPREDLPKGSIHTITKKYGGCWDLGEIKNVDDGRFRLLTTWKERYGGKDEN